MSNLHKKANKMLIKRLRRKTKKARSKIFSTKKLKKFFRSINKNFLSFTSQAITIYGFLSQQDSQEVEA